MSFIKKLLTPFGTPSSSERSSPISSRPQSGVSLAGHDDWPRRPPSSKHLAQLETAHVPLVSLNDCHGCEREGEGEECHDRYPRGFSIDLSSELLGTVKEYGRMVLVGTGKSDWEHDVKADSHQLAGALDRAYSRLATPIPVLGSSLSPKTASLPPGIFPRFQPAPDTPTTTSSSQSSSIKVKVPALRILNSSHGIHDNQDDNHLTESLLVFPDWKVILRADVSKAALITALHLIPSSPFSSLSPPAVLSPNSSPAAADLHSFPLPYQAVILLCSHKKRDKRCHIAAPMLAERLTWFLHQAGFQVDDTGESVQEVTCHLENASEYWPERGEAKEQKWTGQLRQRRVVGSPRSQDLSLTSQNPPETTTSDVTTNTQKGVVGLFKVSHVGGHKFAGNVMVQFPSGAGVWYGRVLPKDCEAIVYQTIMKGTVITELLRGGVGLANTNDKPCRILDW